MEQRINADYDGQISQAKTLESQAKAIRNAAAARKGEDMQEVKTMTSNAATVRAKIERDLNDQLAAAKADEKAKNAAADAMVKNAQTADDAAKAAAKAAQKK